MVPIFSVKFHFILVYGLLVTNRIQDPSNLYREVFIVPICFLKDELDGLRSLVKETKTLVIFLRL